MSFCMPEGARAYFRAIDDRSLPAPKFGTMFDKYYLCLMVGIDERRLGSVDKLERDEFNRSYPTEYRDKAEVIAGLLVDAEIERKGIKPEDRVAIESETLRLLDPNSATRLSEEGQHLLNLYASSGIEKIFAQIYKPDTLEEFLLAYGALWSEDVR